MYIHLDCMATKCITVTEEAYNRLAARKEGNESFSDVINRITHKSSILDLVGLLSPKEAEEIEKNIKTMRKELDKEVEERVAQFQ